VFRWSQGADMADIGVGSGSGAMLNSGAIGLLLLSSLGLSQANKLLWRLNAEAPESQRGDLGVMKEQVARFGDCGHASGRSGLSADTSATALLLPEGIGERRLALGVVYKTAAAVDPDALVASMRHGVRQALAGTDEQSVAVTRNLVAV
jgi:DNA-binding IclR family transcriptional regulator